jgi:hypothetical protein
VGSPLFLSGFFFQLTGLIRFTKARSGNLDEEMNERAEEEKKQHETKSALLSLSRQPSIVSGALFWHSKN